MSKRLEAKMWRFQGDPKRDWSKKKTNDETLRILAEVIKPLKKTQTLNIDYSK